MCCFPICLQLLCSKCFGFLLNRKHSSLARCHFLSAIFSFFKSCNTTCSLSNPPIFLAVVIFYELKLFVILIFLTVKKNNKKGGRVPFLNLTEEDNVAPDHLHERSHTTLIFNLINGQINISPSRVISLDQSDIAAHSRQIYFLLTGGGHSQHHNISFLLSVVHPVIYRNFQSMEYLICFEEERR